MWSKRRALRPTHRGKATLKFKLAAGPYRAVLETQDRFGKKVTARCRSTCSSRTAKQFPIQIPDFVGAPKWSLEPSEEFTALWGTGYDKARAYIEIEHRHKISRASGPNTARHAAIGQAGRHRGDARRLHAACHDGAREPRVSRLAARRCAVDQQEPDGEMGALRLEARTGAEGNLDGGHHRARREEGRRGDGRDAVRRIARRLSAARLDEGASTCSARTSSNLQLQFENMRCILAAHARHMADGLQERRNHLSPLSQRYRLAVLRLVRFRYSGRHGRWRKA